MKDERTKYTVLDVNGVSFIRDIRLESPSLVYKLQHDSFAGFVQNEHIDHSQVSVIAGDGLGGGGNITVNRTLTNADKGSTAVTRHEATYHHGSLTGTLVIDDGTNYRIVMVFTKGVLESVTSGPSATTGGTPRNWGTASVGGEASWSE